MQIKSGLSSKTVVRNGHNRMEYVGVMPAHGYCFDHDETYALSQGDEICPSCERFQTEEIAQRESQYAPVSTGNYDEE